MVVPLSGVDGDRSIFDVAEFMAVPLVRSFCWDFMTFARSWLIGFQSFQVLTDYMMRRGPERLLEPRCSYRGERPPENTWDGKQMRTAAREKRPVTLARTGLRISAGADSNRHAGLKRPGNRAGDTGPAVAATC
jgi:hypothetical protein